MYENNKIHKITMYILKQTASITPTIKQSAPLQKILPNIIIYND